MESSARWMFVVTVLLLVAEAALIATHARNVDFRTTYSEVIERPPTQTSSFAANDVGPNLPPVGRSLFDQLAAKRDDGGWNIAFPFSTLIASLAHAGGCTSVEACTQRVMIPLGRSLQRPAAAPNFFAYPRMVAAFNSAADVAPQGEYPLLKDRLFLGYNEKAKTIEVISFNETAGRFEFQIVSNYGPSTRPQVSYANRAVCMSCHQNFAPLFSRQVWDETNANPQIAQRLAKARNHFDDFPIQIGVDIPNAFDDSTDRANLIPAYELLWEKGCADRRCRGRALEAALQYRLTGLRFFEFQSERFQREFLSPFARNWQIHWPAGLKIPSNDIPNRDPLQFADSERLAHVPARFEALIPRGHKEIWQWETDRFRLIKGIGEFFSDRDIADIAGKLNISNTIAQNYSDPQLHVAFTRLTAAMEKLAADPQAQTALDAPTIRRLPLRNALFRALDIAYREPCCESDAHLPIANVEEALTLDSAADDVGLNYFYAHCARCHGTSQPFPVNFMYGQSEEVRRKVRQCADRILFRLGMWEVDSKQRSKTPMPPETMLTTDAGHWVKDNALTAMRAYIAPFASPTLRGQPNEWLGRSYESLSQCTLH